MLTKKIGLREILKGSLKFLSMKFERSLFSMHLEVTRRCNARCSFCNYWKEGSSTKELDDYSPIIGKFKPLSLTITGGEPLLRQDLEEIIKRITRVSSFIYINCISNGILMTPDRAISLWNAGLTQISISLDFLDDRHDEQRGVKGLWERIKRIAKDLPKRGIDNLAFNTVIMRENLKDLPQIVEFAKTHGWKVSFSTYNPYKNQNFSHRLEPGEIQKIEATVEKLIELKRLYRNITNSNFYLKMIPSYVKNGGVKGCLAGKKWFHVSPDGRIRRCSEKEFLGDWREVVLKQIPGTRCIECWYACRGEAEAPLNLSRISELIR
ncbi:MAG: radical SAM protein [Syntrophobacterales bacterium]|nr:radical SAM protein [Syntrophobacterales bacterium]